MKAGKVCIVIDTETTGMQHDPEAKVVSLGAIAYDLSTMKAKGTFYRVVKPGIYGKSFRHTVKVHGLTRQHIEREWAGTKDCVV